MNKFINCFLLFFCVLTQSSNLLVLSTSTAYVIKDMSGSYKDQSLQLNIQSDGNFFFQYERTDGSRAMNVGNRKLALEHQDINVYANCTITKPDKNDCHYWSNLSKQWLNKDLAISLFSTTDDSSCFEVLSIWKPDYPKDDIKRRMHLPDLPEDIKERYFNDKDYVFYYITHDGSIKYVDCMSIKEEYADFYASISAIKNAHFWNVPLIVKNLKRFLKNYFFDAHGNQRLKNSLRKVFLQHASKALIYPGCLHLGVLIVLLQKNISLKNIFLCHVLIGSVVYILWNPLTYMIKCGIDKIVKKYADCE